MPRMMRTPALLLAGALALSPVFALAGEPYAAPVAAGEAYGYQRSGGSGEAYSYRREVSESGGAVVGAPVRGEVNCEGYCLPPGYTIEDPYRPAPPPAYIAEPPRYEESVQFREPVRTGGGLVYERDDRYGARREVVYEERSSTEWSYEDRGAWRYEDEDYDRSPERCRPKYDRQGRMLEDCGELRLADSFFWGGGGVGPEYIDAGGGGGGGGYAEAGAGASAYASARASVGVNIRIGGRGGHKGGHGGKKGGGGCGKCGGH